MGKALRNKIRSLSNTVGLLYDSFYDFFFIHLIALVYQPLHHKETSKKLIHSPQKDYTMQKLKYQQFLVHKLILLCNINWQLIAKPREICYARTVGH